MVKIVIGTDHRGFKVKEFLKEKLDEYEVTDVGTFSANSVDYPDIAQKLNLKMNQDLENSLGIIICGSGIGVCIAINKYPQIRGALLYSEEVSKSAKIHNNANVLCLSADNFNENELLTFINAFLNEKFAEGRHQARIDKLAN